MKITTVGLDLAKNVFSLHGVDERSNPVLRRTVRARSWSSALPSSTRMRVGMEACSASQHWAREPRVIRRTTTRASWRLNSRLRIARVGSNDANDAEAICEAVARPKTRCVAIKAVEQRAVIAVHRLRQARGRKNARHCANRLRGLLDRVWDVIAQRARPARHASRHDGIAGRRPSTELQPDRARGVRGRRRAVARSLMYARRLRPAHRGIGSRQRTREATDEDRGRGAGDGDCGDRQCRRWQGVS